MRNVFEEYRLNLISWDEAYAIANNKAAASDLNIDYWADQMESLGIDAAEQLMTLLGYKQNDEGEYYKLRVTTK